MVSPEVHELRWDVRMSDGTHVLTYAPTRERAMLNALQLSMGLATMDATHAHAAQWPADDTATGNDRSVR